MNKELSTRTKKSARTAKSKKITPPATDVFTQLCAKQFGVECVKEYRFYKSRQWRFDYAFPRYKIALEVEGGVWTQGRHVRPVGFLGDMNKYNTATLFGWRVFRTTPKKLLTTSTLQLIQNAINGAGLPSYGANNS